MRRFARLPSPALVISCIALFVALGGVSYGLATGVIDSREIKNRSITGNDVAVDRLGGGAIKESTLATVPFSNGTAKAAVVNSAGVLVRERGGASSIRTGPGRYAVSFASDVRGCIYTATIGDEGVGGPGSGFISVASLATNANSVEVRTAAAGNNTPENRSFHLIVSC